MHFDFRAVDQNGVEQLVGDVAADPAGVPVVLGAHRAGQRPDVLRQGRPEHNGVQVAGMIGEVYPLAGIRLRLDPARTGTT